MKNIKIKRALISLSDKSNLKNLLWTLKKFKIEIISSGGTFKYIKKLGFKCTELNTYTNFPEILDGRVKTLHPKIHGGILFNRKKKSHIKQIKNHDFNQIDLVIVNFYPFEETVKKTKNENKLIESIDIGGPSLVRGSAKNFEFVTVITSSSKYNGLIEELERNRGCTSLGYRKLLASHAFMETSSYDANISNKFNELNKIKHPNKKILSGNLIEKLRYGENPHQSAALYSSNQTNDLIQLSGKQLSYNNYNDIYSGLLLSKSFKKKKATVIIKHANICGASENISKTKSFLNSLACDPVSAFGGVVICNFKIDKKTSLEISKIFFEVIVANGYDKNALKILKNKKNLRIIDSSKVNLVRSNNFVSLFNNFLYQSSDNEIFDKKNFKVVSKRKPNKKLFEDLIFSFNICRYVKSNAIVLSKDRSTVGIGAGQPSRFDSCQIAVEKMEKFFVNKPDDTIVAASDAFFPFVDGIERLVQSGVTAVVQPSGSIRDKEIINFANKTNTILVFSKTRHFKH